MKIRKGSIVKVKVNNSWIIVITKILKYRIEGVMLEDGQICDFLKKNIVKVIKF